MIQQLILQEEEKEGLILIEPQTAFSHQQDLSPNENLNIVD